MMQLTFITETCSNTYDEWACHVWAAQGECKANEKFMKASCRKACKACETGSEDDGGK